MTDQLQAMQQQIVAAVQNQLTQFSEQVSATVQQVRDEIIAERHARTLLDDQMRALAAGLEVSQKSNSRFQKDLQHALEERLTEFGATNKRRHEEVANRLDRVVDEANIGMAAAVEAAARPIMREVEHRQDKTDADVTSLSKMLRKFDEQAGRMAAHLNDVTGGIDGRMEAVTGDLTAMVETRVGSLSTRLDEVSAQAARHQSEVSNIVGQRVDDAESRINDKIATAESRINNEVGSRIADIDAYVGRVSVGLDEGIVMLNDRIAEINTRFDETRQLFATLEQKIKDVDVEAIDEMKAKISNAVGEAMLVRIEMERFHTTVSESIDKTAVRLTDVETQLQDQHLDVETAVQLERLEEVERALIALDPAQFVRVDQVRNTSRADQSGFYGSDGSMTPASAPLTTPSDHDPNGSMPSYANHTNLPQ